MKVAVIVILSVILVNSSLYGQAQRSYNATFLNRAPKVDGIEDSLWASVPATGAFFQIQPYNGKRATKHTVVKLAYTPKAIYVLAHLYDSPQQINAFLTPRDQEGQSDWFAVSFDTYDNGLLAYTFAVTASNVQIDYKIVGTKKDYAWDAVWKSKVRHTADGWTVEMRIPFNMLRFNKHDTKYWRVNFFRHSQKTRETDSWSYINIKSQEQISQYGILHGIDKFKSGPRIELLPYYSAGVINESSKQSPVKFERAGLDMKMGLSKSFTLDMMLIPDFGQVQSDEEVLNLSPYETYYTERRPFFTEGTEIFSLGGIFYSRRIGGLPSKYSEVFSLLGQNDSLIDNPTEIPIINATKISGKTKNGFGLGVLNAVTNNTYAVILDTVENKYTHILTEPLTNYNVLAIEKDLPNNSYIGFINTNKTIPFFERISNVSAFEANLKDRTKTFSVYTRIGMSNLYKQWDQEPTSGIGYSFAINKIKGNVRAGLSRVLYSDKYFINDMGYLSQNNVITNRAYLAYYIYKPFWKIRNWKTQVSVTYKSLYSNQNFVGTQLDFLSYGTLNKSLASIGAAVSVNPSRTYDYFEPRVENFVFIQPPKQSYKFWISTDYSKRFALDVHTKFYFPLYNTQIQHGYEFVLIPRLRLGKHSLSVFSVDYKLDLDDFGYIASSVNKDSVYFGRRNIQTVENKSEFNLMISPKSYFSLRLRHYWTLLFYTGVYLLSPDGHLSPLYNSSIQLPEENINFNVANLDFIFKWEFLPGSEFSIVYKKEISRKGMELIPGYFENFDYFMSNAGFYDYLSLKIVLFI